MNYKWDMMTHKERNQLISQNVLKFDCFGTDQGLDWYERHYDMGFWHYTTNLKSAIELAEKVSKMNDSIEVDMKIRKGKGYCRVRSQREMDIEWNSFIEGENMQEAICLAVLKHFEIDVEHS